MSAILQVYQNKQQIARHDLGRERVLIGRSKRCALVVDEDLVSREHAVIDPRDDGFWIEDLGSRNGTRVNGQAIGARHRLRSGDAIAVGSLELIFRRGEDAGEDGGVTIVPVVPEAEPSPGRKVRRKTEPGRWLVRLRVAEGYLEGEIFEDWEGPLRLGRGEACDVPLLSDDYVSKEHAEIVALDDQYALVDLDSENGTFLNSRRLPPGERRQLAHGDKIRLGKESVLVFERIDRERRRQIRQRLTQGCLAVLVLILLAVAFRPADLAGEHLAAAEASLRKGNVAEAYRECLAALKLDEQRREALALKRELEARLKAEEILGKALNYAKVGKWDEAMSLSSEVLRTAPKHAAAQQLKTVLEAIRFANDALVAQNWTGAIRELEGASARFQNSEVIASMLETAKREQQASADLVRARQFLQNHQPAEAERLVRKIPAASTYYPEAAGLLGGLERNRDTDSVLRSALAAYRDRGDLEAALAAVEQGLLAAPGETRLTDLRSRIRAVAARQEDLARAERLGPADGVESLLQGAAACAQIANEESDPANHHARRARDTRKRLEVWLHAAAVEFETQATRHEEARDDKEACRLLLRSVQADPNNALLGRRLDNVRNRIVAECREAFHQGYSLEGSGRWSEARESYRAVTNRGLPHLTAAAKDDYYEKAIVRLHQLGNR